MGETYRLRPRKRVGARVAQVVNAQLKALPRTTRGLWFDPRSCPILVVVISSLGLAWEC